MVLFIEFTGPAKCAVVGWYISTKKLKHWKESNCEIHAVLIKSCVCIYNPAYRLYNRLYLIEFPSNFRNGEKRGNWIGQLRRGNKDRTTWKPSNNDTVCSDYFADGELTATQLFLELKPGYENATERRASQAPRSAKERQETYRSRNRSNITSWPSEGHDHLHVESHHAKTESNILNFHRNTSTACCQAVKNVAVAFIRTY